MAKAQRTLVKSPPEVWQLIDDREYARTWMAELTGIEAEIEAVEREPERMIVWHAGDSGAAGPRIEFALAEKGWGTQVSISSDAAGEPMLEQVLDQLASPERRPFTRA